MSLHANARLSPLGRQLLCERIRLEGWTVAEAAFAANVSERTAYRWLARYDAHEPMTDRSCQPHSSPTRTPRKVVAVIERLRRLRKTSSVIAALLKMAVSTVCAVLKRLGLNRLSKLEPLEPPNRYCRRHPGELIHLDIKVLGRFTSPASASWAKDPVAAAPEQAGKRSTSRSTTPAAWPTSRSCRTRPPRSPSASWNARSPGSPRTAWSSRSC